MFKKRKQKPIDLIQQEVIDIEESDIQQHGKHYSDDKLWKKIGKFAKKAGSSAVYAVLILYYTLQKPEIPVKVKATIVGALGYFILPIDLIPDVAFGAGFIDDLGVLTAALLQVAVHVDDEVKAKAKDKLQSWFGNEVDTSEIDNKLNGNN
ncbi:YkvA family protein [Ornithinibacillus scapharcae]|uniref:YkvA family protein n=1 Tax=Ornithinibacillus scapharcae TaxID=1147159 RepID=UPI000225BCFD|nr:YkvA family protein [Ornithinibacillus scapharcae]